MQHVACGKRLLEVRVVKEILQRESLKYKQRGLNGESELVDVPSIPPEGCAISGDRDALRSGGISELRRRCRPSG
jgi:hypothetical protein